MSSKSTSLSCRFPFSSSISVILFSNSKIFSCISESSTTVFRSSMNFSFRSLRSCNYSKKFSTLFLTIFPNLNLSRCKPFIYNDLFLPFLPFPDSFLAESFSLASLFLLLPYWQFLLYD